MGTQGMNGLDDHVHKYMDMLQVNIQRMSKLSMMCKAWCISLFSAVFLFYFKEGKAEALQILFLPVGLFWFIDSLYLSIEREFVGHFTALRRKILSLDEDVEWNDLFSFKTSKGWRRYCKALLVAFGSFATLLFYGAIAVTLAWVLWGDVLCNAIMSWNGG